MKKFLLIMQQNPYANSQALEALEFAFALCAFDQEVSLLFKGDGLLQLLAKQESEKLVGKDFTKAYADLNVFGIKNVYVDEHSAHDFADDELLLAPQIVSTEQIADLIKSHDVVLAL